MTRHGYQSGQMYLIDDRKIEPLDISILSVGRSPNRAIFAIARPEGVEVRGGWDGPLLATMDWPTGLEVLPPGLHFDNGPQRPIITALIPYDFAKRVLLCSPEGVYVFAEDKATRLLPTLEDITDQMEYLEKQDSNEPLSLDLSMDHAALSPDNRWIACGHQSARHLVFDAITLELTSNIGHMSEYPHYAQFSADGSMLALNSCHFYNGMTLGVPTNLLSGLDTESYELDDRFTALESASRVYSATARNDEFIVGDASGYIRAFDLSGNFRWQFFIGSSIGDIDISADGKCLVVSTYAGFVSLIDLDTGNKDPFFIGTADHVERRRYVFWKNEAQPIIW